MLMQIIVRITHITKKPDKTFKFSIVNKGSSGEDSLDNLEYDEEAIRKAFTYFITFDGQLFKLVKGVGF